MRSCRDPPFDFFKLPVRDLAHRAQSRSTVTYVNKAADRAYPYLGILQERFAFLFITGKKRIDHPGDLFTPDADPLTAPVPGAFRCRLNQGIFYLNIVADLSGDHLFIRCRDLRCSVSKIVSDFLEQCLFLRLILLLTTSCQIGEHCGQSAVRQFELIGIDLNRCHRSHWH